MTLVPCECWQIPATKGLDQIYVFWNDVAPGKGYVTIICYGDAWTAYFGAMSGLGIRNFFDMADVGYLLTALGCRPSHLRSTRGRDEYLARIIGAIKAALKQEVA